MEYLAAKHILCQYKMQSMAMLCSTNKSESCSFVHGVLGRDKPEQARTDLGEEGLGPHGVPRGERGLGLLPRRNQSSQIEMDKKSCSVANPRRGRGGEEACKLLTLADWRISPSLRSVGVTVIVDGEDDTQLLVGL